MLRHPLLPATAAVLLLLTPFYASAGSHSAAAPHSVTSGSNFGFSGPGGTNNPYSVSTALSTALSVGSTPNASSANSTLFTDGGPAGKVAPGFQFNGAPTVQTAIGAAVSIGGNASAAAIDSDSATPLNQH